MDSTIIVALLSLAGTLIGSFCGVISGLKLIEYRLKLLEEKVEKHNNVIERTFILEEKMKVSEHRLDDLERHEELRRGDNK